MSACRSAGHARTAKPLPCNYIRNYDASTRFNFQTDTLPYFESITTTDCGSGKPFPAIFAHALASLDADPVHSVYVGDSLPWDIGGANRAGMISVWLNRTGAERDARVPVPQAQITSLHELSELLSRLSA